MSIIDFSGYKIENLNLANHKYRAWSDFMGVHFELLIRTSYFSKPEILIVTYVNLF